MVGVFSPLSFQKGATGAEVLFHRFRSRQIFRGAKNLCPNFPKLVRNVFSVTFAYTFSPTKIMTTFLV